MAKTKVHGEYLDPSVISGQTQVTAVGADSVLILDATDNALKKALLSDVIETVGSTPTFSQISATSDLTLDVGGDIVLDAAGQQIIFASAGTNVGQIDMAGTDLEIKSLVNNADLFIRGTDGGSEITALTFDMSDAGKATFNAGASFADNVGIGTSSPTDYYSGADNLVISQASGEGGISIVTATNTTGALYFADGTSGNEQYRGGIAYLHNTDNLALVSGGATKATIDASGNLDLDGYIDNTRNNSSISPPSNSDHTVGTRIKFYDAGAAVWYAMGIENNHLWFNADPGFKFYSDSVLSATIDDDGIKFSGDTAEANALDDYEEGTWTPTVNDGTISGAGGYYTKVGRVVTVSYYYNLTTLGTSTAVVQIGGLPFAAKTAGGDGHQTVGSILCRYFSKNQIVSYLGDNATYLQYYNNTTTDFDAITFGEIEVSYDNDFAAHGTHTYITS